MTYRTIALEKRNEGTLFKDLSIALMGSIVMGLLSPLAIPLPFTPVPLVVGTTLPLLFGALLGARRGFLTVLFFLAQGAFGLPVFAGASCGILKLIGPTGGYLIGYALAAYIVGWMVERAQLSSGKRLFMSLTVGMLTIYTCGVAMLSQSLGFANSLLLGVVPFLLGDCVKLLLTYKAVSLYKKWKNSLPLA